MCEGDCDGTPESHGDDLLALDGDGALALTAWPGGPASPVCVAWAAQGPFASVVMRSCAWVCEGQQLGPLDSLAVPVADAVVAMRSEQRAIAEEERKR